MRLPALALVAVLGVGLTACGTNDPKDVDTVSDQGAATSETPADTPAGGGLQTSPPVAGPAAGGGEECAPKVANPTDLKAKPDVTVTANSSGPKDLVVQDLQPGNGTEAVAGKQISVQYVGVGCLSGKQFDASWDRGGEPFAFQLGAGNVIQGWDKGLQGMKVGGRRLLVIPSELGYGESGAGADIAPGEALVFVVDMLAVT